MVARAGTSTNRFWDLQTGCVQPPVMSSSDLRWSNLCLLAACLGCRADCRIENCFRPPLGGCRRQRRQMTRPWSRNKYAGTLEPPKRQTPHGELTVSLRAFFKSRPPAQSHNACYVEFTLWGSLRWFCMCWCCSLPDQTKSRSSIDLQQISGTSNLRQDGKATRQ